MRCIYAMLTMPQRYGITMAKHKALNSVAKASLAGIGEKLLNWQAQYRG
jgi:hypothetical protein